MWSIHDDRAPQDPGRTGERRWSSGASPPGAAAGAVVLWEHVAAVDDGIHAEVQGVDRPRLLELHLEHRIAVRRRVEDAPEDQRDDRSPEMPVTSTQSGPRIHHRIGRADLVGLRGGHCSLEDEEPGIAGDYRLRPGSGRWASGRAPPSVRVCLVTWGMAPTSGSRGGGVPPFGRDCPGMARTLQRRPERFPPSPPREHARSTLTRTVAVIARQSLQLSLVRFFVRGPSRSAVADRLAAGRAAPAAVRLRPPVVWKCPRRKCLQSSAACCLLQLQTGARARKLRARPKVLGYSPKIDHASAAAAAVAHAGKPSRVTSTSQAWNVCPSMWRLSVLNALRPCPVDSAALSSISAP